MEKLKVGIAGTGHLGKLHAKMFNSIDECTLSGVYDINKLQSKTVSEEYGTEAYESMADLLKDVDAVSIAATTSAHYELAKECIKEGKHLFIEKPITAISSGIFKPSSIILCIAP